MIHHPYLQVTLSTRPLGLESQRGVTCQYVLVPRHRKSKKALGGAANGLHAGEDGGGADHVSGLGGEVSGLDEADAGVEDDPPAEPDGEGTEQQAAPTTGDEKRANGKGYGAKRRRAESSQGREKKRAKRPAVSKAHR